MTVSVAATNNRTGHLFAPGVILETGCIAGSLELAEQNQDQHDNEDEAEPAAAIVTGPVKGTATQAAKAAA
jgi:hypothetical protein